jgi:AP-1 complex subunit gamma-1
MFLQQGDLLGNEIVTPSVNGPPTVTKSNKDLLLEIFGDSSASNGPLSAKTPTTTQKSTMDDIMSLFGSSSIIPASAPAAAPPPSYVSTPSAPSVFTLPQTQPQLQTPQASVQPTVGPPRLPSYTAYERNELKITLTPQTSPSKPGVILVLVRFQVLGVNDAIGVNFQVAVPRVMCFVQCFDWCD